MFIFNNRRIFYDFASFRFMHVSTYNTTFIFDKIQIRYFDIR